LILTCSDVGSDVESDVFLIFSDLDSDLDLFTFLSRSVHTYISILAGDPSAGSMNPAYGNLLTIVPLFSAPPPSCQLRITTLTIDPTSPEHHNHQTRPRSAATLQTSFTFVQTPPRAIWYVVVARPLGPGRKPPPHVDSRGPGDTVYGLPQALSLTLRTSLTSQLNQRKSALLNCLSHSPLPPSPSIPTG
jgi:hypothetical protein